MSRLHGEGLHTDFQPLRVLCLLLCRRWLSWRSRATTPRYAAKSSKGDRAAKGSLAMSTSMRTGGQECGRC